MITVYLGIGGNIEREKYALAAWQALQTLGSALRVSPVYECPALGFDSQPFYNWVVEFNTELTLTELMRQLRAIEHQLGRAEHAVKFEDRTIDIDILLYGDKVSTAPLCLPRDDIFRYPFVLQPLYDLAPQLSIPGDGRTVAQIWQTQAPFKHLTPVVIDFPT